MTGPQPQYAPGDPVLVPGIIHFGPHIRDGWVVGVTDLDGNTIWTTFPAADVHPVPPIPGHGPTLDETDARLVAILRDAGREWGPAGVARIAALLMRARDAAVPVPAPPAPTPTGWTAAERAARIEVVARQTAGSWAWEAHPVRRAYWRSFAEVALDDADAAVLALRAKEAATAAPATPTPSLEIP